MRPNETNKRFNHSFTVCVLVVALLTIESGCNLVDRFKRKPEPKVIAVPDKMVPEMINKGEPAQYDGWLFSEPLFNEYAPHWQKGPHWSENE
ncbi:hypothetical protein [Gimesia aquarii]|uniref:Uncharacterized protein n=1 Tax=Gimesia aquarii TaxID=2527964 RepID=A0A517VRA6_9PLAN|nr:hypothetical protein [Gimesia aquarii]QDT95537.1 hypothetical protein V144x_09820 [Gimesia aquarii]